MPLTSESSALLVIDVQQGLFSLPGLDLHQPGELLSCIAALIARARSNGIPIIYTQYCGPPGNPLEAGSLGGQIHAAIAPLPGDLVIQKDDSDAFLRTELQAELERLGVTALVVCGMQSEFCVDTTCRSAYGLGYKVLLVQDGHTTGDAGSLRAEQIIEHHNQTLGRAYVTLRLAADVFL